MLRLYHFTVLITHEPVLFKALPLNSEPDLKRFQIYQRCVNSIKSWFDMYFAISLEDLSNLSCGSYCQLYYVVGFLYRLSVLRTQTWNTIADNEMLSLIPTLDKVIQRFEQARAAASLRALADGCDDAFAFGIRKFTSIKTIWQGEIAQELEQNNSLATLGSYELSNGVDGSFPFSMDWNLSSTMPGIFDDLTWQ